MEALLQKTALPRAKPDRAVLLQTEALPPRRHTLRQTRRRLLRHGPTRLNAAVASRLRVYGLIYTDRCSIKDFGRDRLTYEALGQVVQVRPSAEWIYL